jgi:hypothetical protein
LHTHFRRYHQFLAARQLKKAYHIFIFISKFCFIESKSHGYFYFVNYLRISSKCVELSLKEFNDLGLNLFLKTRYKWKKKSVPRKGIYRVTKQICQLTIAKLWTRHLRAVSRGFYEKAQGGCSKNFLCKFVKISVTFRTLYLEFLKAKIAFLKQISLAVDITYIVSSKIPIFDVKLVLKSRLKLRRFYEFA